MFTCPTLQEYECDWHFLSRDQSHVYEIDVQSPGRLVLDQCGSPSPVAMQLFRRLTTATTATPTSSPPAAASAGPELAWELVRGFDDERCTDTNKPTHVTWWLDPGQHALVIDSTAATANTTGGAASYSVTLSAAASPARGGPTAHCHPPMHACPTAHAAWTDPHGLGLSTATLGRIDALSANATADTAMMAGFVQERSALNVFNKWSGAAFAPATGKLYSPPRDAESVLIINPQTDTADNTTMAGFESTARRSGGKWRSIAYSPSTQRLYAAPCDENAVLIINPISNTTDVTAMAGLGEATDKWSSIAYAPSIGKLFAAPADADAVLVIDPMTNKTDVSAMAGLNAINRSGYTQRNVGNCNGHTFIETREDCRSAALVLGLSANATALSNFNCSSGARYPYGCYFRLPTSRQPAGGLYFNEHGDQYIDSQTRVSICSTPSIFNSHLP